MKPLDIVGQRYGRLIALKRLENKGRRTVWLFTCDCGKNCVIDLDPVRGGKTKSCGCLKVDIITKRSVTHGNSVGRKCTPELRAWSHAKSRCFNSNDPKYNQYGGRGITMCPQWRDNSINFLSDMGKRPKGTSLDRIDVQGNYEPSNCRWATTEQQARNRTDNIYVSHQGEKLVLKDYAKLKGLPYKRLSFLMNRKGFSLTKAEEHLSKA